MALINDMSAPSIRGETDLFRLPNTGKRRLLHFNCELVFMIWFFPRYNGGKQLLHGV